MSDFPAAHSMDTTWFAIDADGYVGMFDSFDSGAVPSDWQWHQYRTSDLIKDWCELSDGLLKIDIYERLEIDGYDMLNLPIGCDEMLESIAKDEYCLVYAYFFVLTSARPIDYLLEQEYQILQFIDRTTADPARDRLFIYVMSSFCLNEIEQFIKSGDIIGGVELDLDNYLYYLNHDRINLLDLMMYRHEDRWENWIAGAYEKWNRVPDRPLKITDLPPPLQAKIGRVKFDRLKFSETLLLQPIEHRECSSWNGANWMDANRVKHERFPRYPQIDLPT
jgi:hypothetical protein